MAHVRRRAIRGVTPHAILKNQLPRGARVLEFVRISVGDGEALRCALCARPDFTRYFPASDIVTRIRSAAASRDGGPGPNVVLCGPEPFAHPELPALVAACVEAGIERVVLETDGAALSVSANAHGVLRAGVRHLRIRLLDAEPEGGDQLAGRPGRTRDALAGVTEYLAAAGDAGLAVVVSAVLPVCPHNLETLPATVMALAARGFHAIRLVAEGEVPASAAAILAAACDTGMVNRLWVEADPDLPLPPTHALHAVPEMSRDA